MIRKFTMVLLCSATFAYAQNPLPLIPQPTQMRINEGNFDLTAETEIVAENNAAEANYLKEIIKQQLGLDLKVSRYSDAKSKIRLSLEMMDSDGFKTEFYALSVAKNNIDIRYTSSDGLFYGIQTLSQLLPLEKTVPAKIQCLSIFDNPKYTWRGMHLDCVRHFFSVDFVKKYIDYLAMYKFNTFHWHLTDDQGWRIEIKQYPKLTEIGAWRNGSMMGHYNEQKYDDKRYGGFYTQEEIKEVVAYAKQRHITVVPEIEMPGHAVAALAAHPELSCTGGPFEVGKQWGVLDDVFCPKEETFTFLENVLTEVISLFPSQYIHIGGDECPKTRWKNCPHCQNLMKAKGLNDEHELQSYFIQRIERFVNSKGRKIIGWDEILEGGLAPNAAVMSWRGTEGGIAAAKQQHYVVMSPGSHCYFDHYQGDPKNEPLAFGGYTPVEKVYSFNPTPKELTTNEAKYILGAQANLWTEYIETTKQIEYMIFPRMMALSEVVWGTSNPEKYADFQNRMIQHFAVLEKKGINYSKAIFEVTTKINASSNGILFALNSAKDSGNIKYTTDGTTPNIDSKSYTNPIEINKSQTIKATYFENGKPQSATTEQSFLLNKASGKKITLINQPHENYSHGGAFTLVDGVLANRSKLGKDWLGFSGKDLEATIDLSKREKISKVTIGVLESPGSWIYYPKRIEVLLSNDGQNFQSAQQFSLEEIKAVKGEVVLEINGRKARYIKVTATNAGKIPEGNPGAGANAWLFVDEIGIE